MEYKTRNEVPNEYKWDLTKWFKTDDDWYKELSDVKLHVNDLNKYKGKIFEGNNLYEILDKYYNFNNRLEHLYAYASLKSDEDLSINKYGKMHQEISNVDSIFMQNTSFMLPEILHSNFNIDELISNNPRLERFKHILEKIELDKQYVKSEDEELLITTLIKDMHDYSSLSSTILNSDINYGTIKDENGEEIELNTGNYRKYLASQNREVRKDAYIQFYSSLKQFYNTIGKNLISFMNRHASISKIRGYDSTKDMDFKNDYVPVEVHDSLVENMKRGLHLFNSYYKKFKTMLNLDKVYPYDLLAPVVKNDKKYTIEDAQKYVYEATSVLGEKYSSIIKKGFDEHWIDYMPYKGKQSGGYCLSVYNQTSNILMSYNGFFQNISTIAHEMGHAVNSYFSFEKNSVEYAYHTLYLAEIPSLLNEILLANYVINGNFSKEEKKTVIVEMLETINSNFFTAVMENELENIVYKRIDNEESISPDDLCKIMSDLINKYYGDSVEKMELQNYIWAKRSHYFTPWYLYKYATCLCGAVHFATKILNNEENALETYLKFLGQSHDKFPNDILKEYGIDLTDSSIYDELYNYYQLLLDELDKLI